VNGAHRFVAPGERQPGALARNQCQYQGDVDDTHDQVWFYNGKIYLHDGKEQQQDLIGPVSGRLSAEQAETAEHENLAVNHNDIAEDHRPPVGYVPAHGDQKQCSRLQQAAAEPVPGAGKMPTILQPDQ